jgi:hypothetical protein
MHGISLRFIAGGHAWHFIAFHRGRACMAFHCISSRADYPLRFVAHISLHFIAGRHAGLPLRIDHALIFIEFTMRTGEPACSPAAKIINDIIGPSSRTGEPACSPAAKYQ